MARISPTRSVARARLISSSSAESAATGAGLGESDPRPCVPTRGIVQPLIRFDHRGMGMSDPFVGSEQRSLESRAEEMLAVFDVAGSEEAHWWRTTSGFGGGATSVGSGIAFVDRANTSSKAYREPGSCSLWPSDRPTDGADADRPTGQPDRSVTTTAEAWYRHSPGLDERRPSVSAMSSAKSRDAFRRSWAPTTKRRVRSCGEVHRCPGHHRLRHAQSIRTPTSTASRVDPKGRSANRERSR